MEETDARTPQSPGTFLGRESEINAGNPGLYRGNFPDTRLVHGPPPVR